jgi:hypothetical protein
MGAATFIEVGYGSDARKVFNSLVEDARYEYGSRGYTGTIAEKDSFKMAKHILMSEKQAYEYAENNQDRYDKWGPAGCIAFADKKVLVEKDFEVKVKAKDANEARRIVEEKMKLKRKRAGAILEVEIPWRDGVVLTTPAGKRKIVTHKSTGDVYFVRSTNSSEMFSTKKEAVARLKELMQVTDRINPDKVIRILKVQDQGGLSYQESSKLATYTVRGKLIQSKLSNKTKGFVFFGWASS